MPRKARKDAIAPELGVPTPAALSASASTLTRIAAEAGVSVSTVSKVLNGRTDVAPATRERIGQLLRRHGYHPGSQLGFGVVDLVMGAGDCVYSSLGRATDPRHGRGGRGGRAQRRGYPG